MSERRFIALLLALAAVWLLMVWGAYALFASAGDDVSPPETANSSNGEGP